MYILRQSHSNTYIHIHVHMPVLCYLYTHCDSHTHTHRYIQMYTCLINIFFKTDCNVCEGTTLFFGGENILLFHDCFAMYADVQFPSSCVSSAFPAGFVPLFWVLIATPSVCRTYLKPTLHTHALIGCSGFLLGILYHLSLCFPPLVI